jgi:CheY-like chemotaxis protein
MEERMSERRGTAGERGCQGTVLVVDDDVDIRETLCAVLEASGYPVVTAENGRDALDKIAKGGRPCLVLLDLMMPVMDGLEFLAKGLESGAIVGVPVVVITAYDQLGARAADTTAAVLKKPFDLGVLLSWVERFCR